MPSSWLRPALFILAATQLLLAANQIIAPEAFHDGIGGFGERNDHYIRDTATFPLALGFGLVVAAYRESWRAPVLAVALVQFLTHTVNHIADAGDSDPSWAGPVDVASLALGVLLIGGMLRTALAQERGA